MAVPSHQPFDALPGKYVDPVQLVYEHRPNNVYTHWVVMRDGTINDEYYDMIFNAHPAHVALEFHDWMTQHFGSGGPYWGYVNQKWCISERYFAVCFLEENDALLFKLRWG